MPVVPGATQNRPLEVSPHVARAAASTRSEQDARIGRLLSTTQRASAAGRHRVVVSLRDLQCVLAEVNIPFDLERVRS